MNESHKNHPRGRVPKTPLIISGILFLLIGPAGGATIMSMSDAPRKMAPWREVAGDAFTYAILLFIPAFGLALIAVPMLSRRGADKAARRLAYLPLVFPILAAVLAALFFA